jgi:hypothetical protein
MTPELLPEIAKLLAPAFPKTGVTKVGLVDKTLLPEPVLVVTPVPPFSTGNAVPLKVTARVPLLVTGLPETLRKVGTVKPTEVTVPTVKVVQVIALETPPAEVKTCPLVPAVVGKLKFQVPAAACGKILTTPELLPEIAKLLALAAPKTGVTKVGLVDKTLLPLPVLVVTPVPPFSTGNAVPLKVTARVPLLVTGLPETLRKVGTVKPTEVTVPTVKVVQVIALETPPAEVKTCPLVPAVVGKLKFQVPAAACGKILTTPELLPEIAKLLAPAFPKTGVTKVGLVDKTLLPLPVLVVTPVPPFSTGNAVPLKLTAKVPLLVTGLPATLKKLGTVKPTEVTVPTVKVVQVIALELPPAEVKTCPLVPAVIGKLKFQVPAAACGKILTTPELRPFNIMELEVILPETFNNPPIQTSLTADIPPAQESEPLPDEFVALVAL